MKHDELYKKAMDAVDELYGDTSVSQQQTLDSMEALKAEINTKIAGLKETMVDEE